MGRILPDAITDSLRTKFLVAGVVVVLVLGGIGGAVYGAVSQNMSEDVRTEYVEDATVQSQHLESTIGGLERRATTLTRMEPVQNDVTGDADVLMRNAEEPSYVAAALYVNRADGDTFARAGKDWGLFKPNSTDLTDEHLQRVNETQGETAGEVGVSDPVVLQNTNQPVAFLSTPVEDHPNRSIVLVVDLAELSRTSLPATADGSYAVVDDEGTTILSQRESEITASDQLVNAGLDLSKSFDRLENASGVSTVAGVSSVDGTDWYVTRRTTAEHAFAVQSFVELGVAGMLGALALVLGIVGMTLVRSTVSDISSLSEDARRLREGDLETAVEVDRRDELGELGDAFDEMRVSLGDQIAEAQAAREEAEERRRAADAFSEHLKERAESYSEAMDACADGDLTQRLEGSSESEAMTAVATSFNEMLDDLEETVRAAREFAAAVEEESGSVATSTDEVRKASAQVTESVQEISVGADEQREKLEAVSSEMESLATTTEEIAASANEVADTAARSATVGREGRDAAEDAIESMEEIAGETADAVEEIDALEAQMREVDKLVEFISDVAHQTNMLALNANIEASRGASGDGDDGGFAVVAQEVKDLAAEAKDAAEDIEGRLERIDEQTERTAAQVRDVNERVAANAEDVRAAASALDEVADHATETNTGVQEISAATEEQAASTEEVVAMTEGATEIGHRTASEAETVAAAAEEQTANLSDVSSSADRLSERASDLWSALEAFEVHDGQADDGRGDDGDDDPGTDPFETPTPSTDGGVDPFDTE
ncbi:methyl-accepting chemotaxis protein [Halorubellus sp. PRR65]|uniref:methyl-accepting chemotaxis protein n=2 Tax=Halobacteriales TaxID=2235 RepID=UPI002B262CB2|nr:methyl-accepting chemotaxis protein [Halorubellus sp. PRR65]